MYYFSLILCAIVWMLRNLNFIRNTVYFPYEWIDKCEAFAISSWLTIKIEQTWSSFSDELTSHNSCIIVCKLIKSNNSFHWWFFEGEKNKKNSIDLLSSLCNIQFLSGALNLVTCYMHVASFLKGGRPTPNLYKQPRYQINTCTKTLLSYHKDIRPCFYVNCFFHDFILYIKYMVFLSGV